MGNPIKRIVDSETAVRIRSVANQYETIVDEHAQLLNRFAQLEQEARAIRRSLQDQRFQLQAAESDITNLRYGLHGCGTSVSKVGALLEGLESNLDALRKHEGMAYD